mmetsp:Transcript_55960/g.144056  ORF Transcript_55960/g.144056 Transcript_55960/m.144056 type:complete len:203 (-) Transcript_55960:541-1149(-)
MQRLEVRPAHLLLLALQRSPKVGHLLPMLLTVAGDLRRLAGLLALQVKHRFGKPVLLRLQPTHLALPPLGKALRVLQLLLRVERASLPLFHILLNPIQFRCHLKLLLVHDALHLLELAGAILALLHQLLLLRTGLGKGRPQLDGLLLSLAALPDELLPLSFPLVVGAAFAGLNLRHLLLQLLNRDLRLVELPHELLHLLRQR